MGRICLFFLFATMVVVNGACQQNKVAPTKKAPTSQLSGNVNQHSQIAIDSLQMGAFFAAHPKVANFKKEVTSIYRKYNFQAIWLDENGVIEFGHSLYNKVKELDKEGVVSVFPYQEKIDGVFVEAIENTLSTTETDLMITSLFLFYAEKVFKGIDEKTTTAIEWLLPRKDVSYENLLDSVLLNPKILNKDEQLLFRQYYKLRDVLQKYRQIELHGGWNQIALNPKLKGYKPGDTATAILQIRQRLFASGDISHNNGTNKYDSELVGAVKKYQARNGKIVQSTISPDLIREMNVPIGTRIRQIMVNMERCRWISADLAAASELVVVNIPSYKLNFFREGKSVLESAVVVGKSMNKTVIFSGNLSFVVFSPYWVVPQSIINKEIKPAIAKNPNYLASHNMEWNNGQVRQKPGKNNSLGQVKFIFPNSNNIYLHDTPSKSLFARETRAFSHGCIRVAKPRDLALTILKDDPNWTPEKINAAMNAGKENWYSIKTKIPVYIGYFTAWVDQKGEINFFDDIYKRDEKLFKIMTN